MNRRHTLKKVKNSRWKETSGMSSKTDELSAKENSFHTDRRMWIVVDGTLLIAPANCPYTHYEWLSPILGWQTAMFMKNATRGYVLSGRLVAYKGDFDHHVDHDSVITALLMFQSVESVGFGPIVNDTEQPWRLRVEYSLDTYLEITKSHLEKLKCKKQS